LKKRDMAGLKLDKPRGVLHAGDVVPEIGHWRYWPSTDLAPFVEHYWTVAWDLGKPLMRETLPHPVVHIVFENGTAKIAGPTTRRFTTTLFGAGRVFGIKFHPGGFRPFVTQPISSLADRTVELSTVFEDAAQDFAMQALSHRDHQATIAVLEAFLRSRGPRNDATAVLMARIAARMAEDRQIKRIEQVAQEFSIGLRTLQRQFRDYVGVHPKWVIQRYRLHEALARIDAGMATDWTALALDLGYADQAHLIRDFKKIIGRTPTEYARAQAREDDEESAVSGARR
jgi:AraC-like DNA-binding protein